jgi:hypothetical protein
LGHPVVLKIQNGSLILNNSKWPPKSKFLIKKYLKKIKDDGAVLVSR